MQKNTNLEAVFSIIHHRTKQLYTGSELIIEQYGRDPFLILIFCMLSLRTRDVITLKAARKLFSIAKTPDQILNKSTKNIETYIYPVGFYHQKAKQIRKCAEKIIEEYHGKVPHIESALLSLPGVGRKTMNLVLQDAFLKPAFCVDTHVHRIANKLQIIKTKTPEQTEVALKILFSQSEWKIWNRALLLWGQYICKPSKHQCNNAVEQHI